MSSKSARSRPSAADRLRVPGKAPHVVLVEARFYDDLADELAAGAIAVLEKSGASIERVVVPGALEIPAAIAMLVTRTRRQGPAVDGFVALGCVIRGETTHYEIVSGESARGLMSLSLTGDIAIGNGILTVETEKQAWVRARQRDLDKGGDAARACLRMIALRRQPRGTT